MVRKITLSGPVKSNETLKNLMFQAGEPENYDTLVLDIASQGGCVEEGIKIMIWLNSISSLGKDIISVVSANAYSIASIIMLVADYRYISRHGKIMVHNPMIPLLKYTNASELELHVSELRNMENMLQMLYCNFTNIEKDKIKVLMDNETYLSPDEAVKLGFADSVIDIKPRPYSMMAIKKEVNMNNKAKVKNMLNVVIAAIDGKEVVNQMYYNTKGDEIQIYQANPAKYAIGDKTSIENGDVRISDGTLLKIKNFEIVDIEKEVEKSPVEDAVSEDAVPEGDVKKEDSSSSEMVSENNVGPAPKEIDEKPKAVAQAMPSEVKEVVDAEQPVVEIKKSMEEGDKSEPIEETITATPVSKESDVETVEDIPSGEPVSEELMPEHDEVFKMTKEIYDTIMSRIDSLEKLVGKNSVSNAEFQSLATEAIDSLARNTSSAFKPEARKVKKVEDNSTSGMTLFQRMRYNRLNKE